jgi:hypothetical protein
MCSRNYIYLEQWRDTPEPVWLQLQQNSSNPDSSSSYQKTKNATGKCQYESIIHFWFGFSGLQLAVGIKITVWKKLRGFLEAFNQNSGRNVSSR